MNNPLVNIGELSRPATVLVEKVAEGVGGFFKPYQIRRIAQAEADADQIKALAEIETSELRKRALQRFIAEEARKQDNIEAITSKALPDVADDADPGKVEDDWITNFFDKCRLISDEEMQNLWAKVLAGEANAAGTYSKRTVDYLGSLDKDDARLFGSLCGFGVYAGHLMPLVYDLDAPIYETRGISFSSLRHLDDIGLLRFEPLSGLQISGIAKAVLVYYYGEPMGIEFPNPSGNSLATGHVMLSKVGAQLAPICGSRAVPDFPDYLFSRWISAGIACFSPFPRSAPSPYPLLNAE